MVHPRVIDVTRFEAADDHHVATRAGHRHREQAFAARFTERAEVGEHPPVRCAPESDRENDPVAALGHRLLDRADHERFGPIADHEFGEFRVGRERRKHRLLHPDSMPWARRNDHQRLLRSGLRVLDDKRQDAIDLGVHTLHRTGVAIRHPGPVGDEIERDAAVSEETSRPRQRLDLAAVEAPVDEFGEILAAGAVAPRE